MQKLRFLILLVLFASPFLGFSQGYEERLKAVDILNYDFSLTLSDDTDRIEGKAIVDLRLLQSAASVHLDLVAAEGKEKGMTVSAVHLEHQSLTFNHRGEDLEILLPEALPPSDLKLEIYYSGIPADGLIISNSERDGRSFFGDNWPNRAHHWLPVVDHPADKASVAFTVLAPAHYQVVANGRLVEQTVLANVTQVSRWVNEAPLPTKVMVIGAADFSIENVGTVGMIPVSSWVFRQDEVAGFHDYAQGKAILEWFVGRLGAYPWEKLANVQSRTRYGGMENASCIFYSESSVTGDGSCEALMAHEIAHQWFGNSASEANWYHIWLSEGFATYWTHVYYQQVHGQDTFMQRMLADRAMVTNWPPTTTYAVVDPRISDLNQLLNINSYQKGSWILHMLRHTVGDELFFKGLREYYSRFKLGNALTSDLQKALEDVSGQDLKVFFQQWLFRPGHPKLDVVWKWNKGKKLVTLQINQTQAGEAFLGPLDIGLFYAADTTLEVMPIELVGKSQKTTVTANRMPDQVILDPGVWLLHEGKVRRK